MPSPKVAINRFSAKKSHGKPRFEKLAAFSKGVGKKKQARFVLKHQEAKGKSKSGLF